MDLVSNGVGSVLAFLISMRIGNLQFCIGPPGRPLVRTTSFSGAEYTQQVYELNGVTPAHVRCRTRFLGIPSLFLQAQSASVCWLSGASLQVVQFLPTWYYTGYVVREWGQTYDQPPQSEFQVTDASV